MKFIICLVVFLGVSPAVFSTQSNCAEIKGKNLYLEPRSNHTIDKDGNARIIGGEEVDPHSRAYQVALIINGETLCSGSLISPNYVLTAAHCTYSASYIEIILGAHNVNTQESTQLRITSNSVIVHENYMNPDRYSNDISLLQTNSHIVTNNYIQIIRLAEANDGTYAGFIGTLAGWGTISDSTSAISPVLLQVELLILPNPYCEAYYEPGVVKSSNLCTYGYDINGPCNGDSGGPLVVGNVQVGLVSFISSRGCETTDPTGYVRISSYRTWINENSDL